MMEMHTAKLPDGTYAYIIGSTGEWSIWVSAIQCTEPIEVQAWGRQVGLPVFDTLAKCELFLERYSMPEDDWGDGDSHGSYQHIEVR